MTINRVFIVGAGLMGKGIAIDLASQGVAVSIHDRERETLNLAPSEISDILDYLKPLGFRVPEEFRPEVWIEFREDLRPAKSADLVIEAISEDLGAKRELYLELEPLLKEGAILTTNTSSLNVVDLARDLTWPERFLGTHFFNPPYLLPLVEIFWGPKTDRRHVDRVFDFLEEVGKSPVRVNKEVPGLIANRLQFALLWEALSLLEEGVAEAEAIDRVVSASFGRRLAALGPFANADLGGLHTYLRIFEYLRPSMPWDGLPSVLEKAVSAGQLGVSSGHGLLEWGEGGARQATEKRDRTLIALLDLERDREEET